MLFEWAKNYVYNECISDRFYLEAISEEHQENLLVI